MSASNTSLEHGRRSSRTPPGGPAGAELQEDERGPEDSSVVLRGSGAFVVRGHVVQVAAVFVATVVQGLALEKSRGRGEMGDGGHDQVVVGWRLLGWVGEVLLGMMVRGVELHVGERVSDRSLGRDRTNGWAEA